MGTFNYGELAKDASKGFEPLPVGEYDVEVTEAEFKVASTGSPMDKLTLTISSGPHKGRKLWTQIVMKRENPNSVAMYFANMSMLGLGADYFAAATADSEEDLHGIVCQALIGRTARVSVKHRDWKGRTQNDVTILAPKSGAAASPVAAAPAAPASASPSLPPGL